MITIKNGRPTFYNDNNTEQEIRAGGLLLYRYEKDMKEPEFLMIKSRDKYEDFGGRTDMADKSIDDTICREADEESNGILNFEDMVELIKDKQTIYVGDSKYLLYIVKTNKSYNPDEFGTFEIHDKINRTVEWIKLSQLKNKKFSNKSLHVRLKCKQFFEFINKLTMDS